MLHKQIQFFMIYVLLTLDVIDMGRKYLHDGYFSYVLEY